MGDIFVYALTKEMFIGYQGSLREVTKAHFILSFLHSIAFCPILINLLRAAMPYISNI